MEVAVRLTSWSNSPGSMVVDGLIFEDVVVSSLPQSNSTDDLALTQKIRQAVIKDRSLSINAKNVKIIARDGKVTLKGPVDSQQEKDTIATEAAEIAGEDKVDNQLLL